MKPILRASLIPLSCLLFFESPAMAASIPLDCKSLDNIEGPDRLRFQVTNRAFFLVADQPGRRLSRPNSTTVPATARIAIEAYQRAGPSVPAKVNFDFTIDRRLAPGDKYSFPRPAANFTRCVARANW
jgi:hypothetical protein